MKFKIERLYPTRVFSFGCTILPREFISFECIFLRVEIFTNESYDEIYGDIEI